MSYLKKLEKYIEENNQREEINKYHHLTPSPDYVLQHRLSELAKRDIAIKIYSEILDCDIWICGTTEMAKQLRRDDPEVTVYTANEMRRLMSLNPDFQSLRSIHDAKSVFPGSKVIEGKEKVREEY